jgi:hypothetical protein
MTQPTFAKRLAGRPPVTAALFLTYGLLILGWLNGGVSWWLAFIAVIAAFRTFRAYREMRTYNTWLASWRAMGTDDSAAPAPAPVANKRNGRTLVIIAVLVAVVLPVAFQGSTPPPGVVWLWVLFLLFLAGKVLYQFGRVGRRLLARPARQAAKAESVEKDAPVAWLLPRAASSPSLAEAERRLPEYSARLLTEKQHAVVRH